MNAALSEIFVPLHRIIPFSNVEGQGNRTSIFLQGCALNCLYCHNPETIPLHSSDAKKVTLQYLFEQVMDAVPFIRGVTVSGGEPTIHHQKLVPLFKALREQGLTCYLDSSGFFHYESMQALIELTDKFLFDLKGSGIGLQSLCFDHQNTAGKVSSVISQKQHTAPKNLLRNLENLSRLLALGKIEEVRLVYLTEFFDAKALIHEVAFLLGNYPNVLLKIIRMHTKGARDVDALECFVPTIAQMDELVNFARHCGVKKVTAIY